MAERTVEVVCQMCGAMGCYYCGEKKWKREVIKPDSLAALQIALAEAVMEEEENDRRKNRRISSGHDCSVDRLYLEAAAREDDLAEAVLAAIAAVRSHPDYRGGNQGKGVGE